MAKKKDSVTREDILEQALIEIRSKFGDGAIMRLGDEVQRVAEVIPSGILPLDVALGIGGIPRGRVVEIFGPEGGGKTTIALHILAEAQKTGGLAAFIDAEHALDPRLASSLGVDTANLYMSQPDSGEQAFYILDTLVRSGAFDVVVIDSVAALTPQAEIDGKMGEGSNQMGLHARLMSYALRRLTAAISKSNTTVIFINQLRAQISTGYGAGPTETTTGGRALKFYSSVRIEVKRGKQVTQGETVIGHELWIKVVKNKQAPPFRTAHTTLIYGKGVPKAMSVLDMAIDREVVKRKGSWLAYKGETLGQGKEGVASYLDEHPELMEEITKDVLHKVAEGLGLLAEPVAEDEDAVPGSIEDSVEALLEEGVLKLDITEDE
ncbi:MAG: recombinase RecA [Synergistaceae bacterium]|jgi:recombination protein RecA|nr:recombinase RecA [Synergistaceae bacterium]PKL03605.1 MAG: recombinase RecA [Synergistetes bacterium HGW-Synergistetes-1]MBP9558997.1 recombinase RecA [Synergistaceae bacterium]MCE5183050.1 recombinase RecA [Synergistaceae bacterium]MDD2351356.1 recombinase RecA [Synergistaceae bacterium]